MRLGDLDALKKKIEGVQYSQEFCIEHQIDYSVSMQMLGMVIDSTPPVDAYPFEQVQELVKLNQQFAWEIANLKKPQGEWITENLEEPYGKCNQCGEICEVDNFCGNCGAKMRKESENEQKRNDNATDRNSHSR